MAQSKLKWTRALRFNSRHPHDYVLISTPKEGETFVIETIYFKR